MNMFDKLMSVEDRPKRIYGHGGRTRVHKVAVKKSKEEMLAAQVALLKSALDQIVNGTLMDEVNHREDGMNDFHNRMMYANTLRRTVDNCDVKRWVGIAEDALKKCGG